MNLSTPIVNIDDLTISLYRLTITSKDVELLPSGRNTPDCYTLFNPGKFLMASFIPGREISPLMYGRFHKYKHYIREFLWDVSGGDNVNDLGPSKFLWETWANSNGSIPFSYGTSWRRFASSVDQLERLVEQIKRNPHSRRHVLITYDPTNPSYIMKSDKGVAAVPPCHTQLIFNYDGEYLHVTVVGRSQDVVTGLPGDLFRYSLMLLAVSNFSKLNPGNVYMDNTNLHFYEKDMSLMRKIYTRKRIISKVRPLFNGKISLDKDYNNFSELSEESVIISNYPDKPTVEIPFMKIPGGIVQ